MRKNKELTDSYLNIVFNGRNKDYGAYELRFNYNRRMRDSLLSTFIMLSLIFGGVMWVKPTKNEKINTLEIKEINLKDIKLNEPVIDVKPKVEPKATKIKTVKFTPPIIKTDKEIKEEIPTQEEITNSIIGTEKQDGKVDDGIIGPSNIDEGKDIIENKVIEDIIFERVEIEASFPGGPSKWKRYLEQNLNGNIPLDNNAPEGLYRVIIQFIVDSDGLISEVKPLTNHGYGMEEESIKIIKRGPKWTPAIQNGIYVKAYRKQIITFSVSEN